MKAIALIGPTAVGKTAHSFALAEALGAEIISADSRQVYRYMDVGTDKASPEARRQVVHHLIDVVDPDQIFTTSDFCALAQDAARRMVARGKVPLLVGGTPFYYQAFQYGGVGAPVPPDEDFRRAMEPLSSAQLYERLCELDADRAAQLAPGDRYRIIRALEICHAGHKASDFAPYPAAQAHDVLYLGLTKDKEVLKRRIAGRVKEQFEGGYPEEVAWLLAQGYSPDLPSMKGFGYKELVAYHQGRMTYQEALERDIIATCQFAKRQRTWWRKFDAQWFDLDLMSPEEVTRALVTAAKAFLDR